jgi:hypothetical protein
MNAKLWKMWSEAAMPGIHRYRPERYRPAYREYIWCPVAQSIIIIVFIMMCLIIVPSTETCHFYLKKPNCVCVKSNGLFLRALQTLATNRVYTRGSQKIRFPILLPQNNLA